MGQIAVAVPAPQECHSCTCSGDLEGKQLPPEIVDATFNLDGIDANSEHLDTDSVSGSRSLRSLRSLRSNQSNRSEQRSVRSGRSNRSVRDRAGSACSNSSRGNHTSPYFFGDDDVDIQDQDEVSVGHDRTIGSPSTGDYARWLESCSRSMAFQDFGAQRESLELNQPRSRPKISQTLTEAKRNVLDCDMDLLRGIRLQTTLRRGGYLWRCKPHKLTGLERMQFYRAGAPTKSIDIFFSHTWKTPGKWKALSLFVQGNWLSVVIAWVLTVFGAFWLCVFDLLPMPFFYEVNALGFKAQCPLGFWMLVLGMVASLLTPLASAYIPSHISMSPVCFVDVACIHQADPKLMARGIYGIGGILSVSEELRVLWSDPYLSRLWCVFELAAFRKANPFGKISLVPLFVEAAVACIWILFNVTSIISLIVYAMSPQFRYVEFLLQVVPVLIAAHMLRVNYLAKHKLLSDLETFDLGCVQCSSDFDREFIHEAITQWYGSAANFTAFVQDDLREELITPILSSSMPLAYYLILNTPNLSAHLEIFLSLWKEGAPAELLTSYAVGTLLGYCLCWCPAYLALLVYLCDRFAAPRYDSILLNRAQSAVIGLTVVIVSDFGNFAARYCAEQGLFHSLVWTSCAVIAAALARSKGGPCV